MGLNYHAAFIALASSQLEALVLFYQELLGFPPAVQIPGVYAEFQLLGLRLGIFCPKPSHQPEFANSTCGSSSLCLEVANLEAAMQAVQQAYTVTNLLPSEQNPLSDVMVVSHGREVYAYDPDGNRLILHEARVL